MRRLAAAVALCAVLVTVGTVSTIQPAAGVTALGSTLVIKRDVRYGSVGTMPLRLDVYAPLSGTQRPVVVLLHGGEWIRGDKRDLEPEARRIAAMGWVAVSVNYRLTGTRCQLAELVDHAGFHVEAIQLLDDGFLFHEHECHGQAGLRLPHLLRDDECATVERTARIAVKAVPFLNIRS